MTDARAPSRPLALGGVWAIVAGAVAVLSVAPVVWAYATTFWSAGRLSLANYASAWAETARAGELLWNTGRVCAGTLGVALILGVPLGFVLFRTRVPGRSVWLVVTAVSPLVPMPVVAAAWLAACGIQGWLTPLLKPAFAVAGLRFSVYTVPGAAWIMGTAYAPLVALITGMAACVVPRVLEEDGLLDASRLVVALRVTLWQCMPGIMVAAVVVLALCAAEMAVTDVLVIRTFAEEVYTEFQLSGQTAKIVAMSAPSTLTLTLCIALVLGWTRARWRELYTVDAGADTRRSVSRRRWLPFAVAALVLGVHPGLPVASLLVKLGSVRDLVQSVRVASGELVTSLCLSACTATLAAAAALPLAAAIRRGRGLAWAALAWVGFALALPSPIVGIALAQTLNRPGPLAAFYDSPAVLVAACLVRFLPFAAIACLPAASAVSPDLDAAATLDGAGPWDRLTAVLAPLCGRGLMVAWLLVFVLSMGELGASVLVAPPGCCPLPVRIFTLLHYGVDEALAGICLVLLGVTAVPVSLMMGCLHLWGPESRRQT